MEEFTSTTTTQRRISRAGDLSVQQLQIFQRVYELGGYAAAARDLDLSVPTVWQHIQTLQRLYRFPLFEKRGRGIVPTSGASELYTQLSNLLAGLDSTFDISGDAAFHSRPITLVTGVRMMMEELAIPLYEFRKSCDNRLVIRHGDNKTAEALVLAGEADVALTLEAGHDKTSPLIHFEPAYVVEFLAVCRNDHPFAAASSSSLRELVKHELVVPGPGTHGRDALDHALHRQRLTARISVETDNSGFTVACVRAGLGVGVLAGRAAGPLCEDLTVRSLRRQLGMRQIVFMWKKGRLLHPPLAHLVDAIKEHHADAP